MAGIPDNIVAILGVDNAGAITNIDPNLVFNKQVVSMPTAIVVEPVKKEKAAEPTIITNTVESTIALNISADPTNIPMVNRDKNDLENSLVWQIAKKIGINTKSPRWLLDLYDGSVNVTPVSAKDGYKLKNFNFAYGVFTTAGSEQIYLGDDTYLPIVNLKKLLIRGLIPVTGTGIDRILFINDLGIVTAKTDIFLESLNGLTNKIQVFAFGTTGTTPNVVSTVVSTTGTHTFNFPLAASTGVTAGLISKAQYDIFNAKEPAITGGTAAQYWNGSKAFVDFNTSARAAFSAGTGIGITAGGVISYSGTVYTDTSVRNLFVAGTGITYTASTGTIAYSGTVYTDTLIRGLISLTTTGTGAATYNSTTGALNIPTFTLSGVSATGELFGTYPNPSLVESAVTGKLLTGLASSTTGSVAATDSILTAFSKVQTQLNSLVGAVVYKGTWNASTNTPTIVSSVGTQGNYYIVNVAGTTTINGISTWAVGDWIIFNGSTWQKVDNAATVYTAGTGITITSGVIATTITQYTDALARASVSAGTGISYNSGTGVITSTITQYTDTLARGAFSAGTGIGITVGGVISYSGTIYTDTSVRALISQGAGITYNSATGVISYSGTVYNDTSIRGLFSAGTGITISVGGVIATTITQYTDTNARASVSAGTGISYNSGTGVITSTITQYTDTNARASVSAGTGISYNSGTGVITSTITQYTDTNARAAFSAGTNISISAGVISYTGTSYSDSIIKGLFSGGTGISYNSTSGAFTCNITQYTDALARGAISLTTTGTSGAATYNSTTGVLNIPAYAGGGVTSFNTRTGAITLTSLDVTTALGFTPYNSTNPNGYTTNTGTVTSVSGTSSIGLTITNTITTSGQLVIGQISDDLRMRSLRVGSFTGLTLPSAVDGKVEASGDIVGYSQSDERLKENIKVIENATDKLSRIRGVKFDWKKEFEYLHGYEGSDIGVIAQDVEVEFPEATRQRENGYLAVRYEKLIGLLVAAVNEQSEEIKLLKSKLK